VLDGKKYGHIFDPNTGYPPENDLKSVTIVSKDSTLADAYSTALFVMGKEKALAFQKKHADKFDAVLVTADNKIIYTQNLKDRIFIANEDGKYDLAEG
jgi:thiamine biosynthesis lipoprotein